ncbi:sialoadhesin-like [Anabas testudineus]|uniref:sialoadhesin-like n=1 Tax=Anabas testudineus TaxID=64144 RepID=UPI00143D8042|nr:sialoadhesin-like [Anabas testudineus]
MSPTAASGFFFFLLSVSVVQGQNDWGVTYTSTKICGIKGSTVDIHCSYRYPYSMNRHVINVQKTLWFTKENNNESVDLETDSDYTGRVMYQRVDKTCTLKITDLRQRDSAVYKFRFITNHPDVKYTGEPGVTLSVTDLQVQVIRSTVQQDSTWAELKCQSTCPPDHTTYIWYKNGQIQGETSSSSFDLSISPADRVSCAVKGHEKFPSPSVYRPNLPSVSVSPSEIVEGSSVNLTCSSDANPAANYTWYKNDTHLKSIHEEPQFVFTSIKSSDSGQYYCEAGNTLGKSRSESVSIDVKYRPNLPSVSVSPSEIVEGSSVTLTCSSDANPAANYTWFESRPDSMSPTAASGFFFFLLSVSVVQGQNDWGVTYTSTQICGIKGSTVDIHCYYTYPSKVNKQVINVQKTLWFTKGNNNEPVDLRTDSDYIGRVTYQCVDKACTLKITDLRQRDSAVYKFRFITNHPDGKYTVEPGVTLSVTDLQVQVIRSTVQQDSTWAELKCQSTCPLHHSTYIWYKNKQIQRETSSSFDLSIFPADRVSCAVKRHEKFPSPSVYRPNLPSVSVSPSEIVEGSSVTLTCSSDANPAANYTWYKSDTHLKSIHEEPQFVFRSIKSSDSGQYYCEAGNKLGTSSSKSVSIDVKYRPNPPSVSVSPSEIVEGSSVTLTCSSDSNPAAKYTWYKSDTHLKSIHEEPQFVFRSIKSSDSGQYYCEAGNKLGKSRSESVSIDVKYRPNLPSVSVSPSEIVEGSSVTLTCSSDANPAANYTWYKENEESPKASGQIFTITDIRAEHSGNYYCEVQNSVGRHNNTLHLTVARAWKLTTAAVTAAVLLIIMLIFVFLLIRKKRSSTGSSEPEEKPDNREQFVSDQEQPEDQENLQYSTVHFINKPTDPVYSNIRGTQPGHMEEPELTEYSYVRFNSGRAALRFKSQKTEADALYSTVNKTK